MSAITKNWKQEIEIEEIQKSSQPKKKSRESSREPHSEQRRRSDYRERERPAERSRERHRSHRERSGERYRERSRERVRERSRERPRERPRERSRDRIRERSRERYGERPRERSGQRSPRERSRERSRSRSRVKSRDRVGKRMKYRHSPEDTNVDSELPIEPIPDIPVEAKHVSLQVVEEQDEFQQGNIQDASLAAAKATQEMDEKIKERRERMLAWRKERKDIKEDKPVFQKTFNLDDDEDDSNALNQSDHDAEVIPLSDDVLSLLNAVPEQETEQPTRTAVFGGKKVKGKKNAITFGLKKRDQPVKKILKPSALTQFNHAEQDQVVAIDDDSREKVTVNEVVDSNTMEVSEVIDEADPLDSTSTFK